MTPEQIQQKLIERESYDLATAARINEFLQDPVIAGFLRDQQDLHYQQFLKADSDEKRRSAWASANAFEKLKQGINAIQDNAKQAAHTRALREAANDRLERAKSRK